MKHAVLAILTVALMMPIAASAQNHAEAAVFGDYFRAQATKQNLFGVGGRLGFAIHPNVKLEVDGAYDFARNYSSAITGACSAGTANNCGTTTVGLRATHFSIGPKFQLGKDSPVRLFVFAKGGFVRFGASFAPVTFGNFPVGLQNRDVNGTFYPGGGIEAFAGIFGIRGDVGDEIYFDRGAHNNIRITFGPVIRF